MGARLVMGAVFLVLLEMDSVCVRFSLLEMDSLCVQFCFTRNLFSVCQV